MGSFKQNNPGCQCCGGGTPPTPTCGLCAVDVAAVTLTFANFVSNTANCSLFNTSWVVPYASSHTTGGGVQYCRFYYTSFSFLSCFVFPGQIELIADLIYDGTYIWWHTHAHGSSSQGYFYAKWQTTPIIGSTLDCAATYNPTIYDYYSNPGYCRCDNLNNATCQIN